MIDFFKKISDKLFTTCENFFKPHMEYTDKYSSLNNTYIPKVFGVVTTLALAFAVKIAIGFSLYIMDGGNTSLTGELLSLASGIAVATPSLYIAPHLFSKLHQNLFNGEEPRPEQHYEIRSLERQLNILQFELEQITNNPPAPVPVIRNDFNPFDLALVQGTIRYYTENLAKRPNEVKELLIKVATPVEKNEEDIMSYIRNSLGSSVTEEFKKELCDDLKMINSYASKNPQTLNLTESYSQAEVAKMVYQEAMASVLNIIGDQQKGNSNTQTLSSNVYHGR
jgi:hypothetical protein